LHSFCAAAGPDFRRHFIDSDPTGNADVAPTVRGILEQSVPAGASGRVIQEALGRTSHQSSLPNEQTLTSYLVLQGQEVVTKLRLTRFDGEDYLEDSSVSRNSLGGSP
jgi:hypothetical protein